MCAHPHDRFARKVLGDPIIAADFLRSYADPFIDKYVDLSNSLGQMTDPTALESLTVLAATCGTIEEFAEALK